MSPLEALEHGPLSHREKGMPPVPGLTLADVAGQGWNVLAEDMSFPVALIREDRLLHNARWMERFALDNELQLYPHGKTTMAPQLFDLQLRNGCSGITAANVIHAETYLEFGVRSILIANQVTGKQALSRLKQLCERFAQAQFFLILDSHENALEIHTALDVPIESGQIKPLIEIGAPGGRTGLRSVAQALELAAYLVSLGMPACGLEAFEGIFNVDDVENSERKVRQLLEQICAAYSSMDEGGLLAEGDRYLTAGGSWYYDLVADYFGDIAVAQKPHIIIRAGCYISHDSGMCKRAYTYLLERGLVAPGDHLQPALEVWAQVQSQPESGLAFANAGKRDLSYDVELPVVRYLFRPGVHDAPRSVGEGIKVTALNDQHAFLKYDESVDLKIGDLLCFGISHPCTTFDKWKYLFTVDAGYTVSGAVKTFF